MLPMPEGRRFTPSQAKPPGSAHPINANHVARDVPTMSDQAYRLLERHQKLDARLRLLQALRWPDPFEIARLKKLKLAAKDRLARLAAMPRKFHA